MGTIFCYILAIRGHNQLEMDQRLKSEGPYIDLGNFAAMLYTFQWFFNITTGNDPFVDHLFYFWKKGDFPDACQITRG